MSTSAAPAVTGTPAGSDMGPRFYDTLSRSLKTFEPLVDGKVGVYG